MTWKPVHRLISLETKQQRAMERRVAAGLKPTREQHAVYVAQRHIAAGATEPYRYLTHQEALGGLVSASYHVRNRERVTRLLYRHAFAECLRANAQGRRPRWENLDLVDSPILAERAADAKRSRTKRKERELENMTGWGPTYDEHGNLIELAPEEPNWHIRHSSKRTK